MTLINTISQVGYMTILFVVIIISIALCVLLFFCSRHERRRFKESRAADTPCKLVDLDTEIKKRVADARGKTKFTIISFYLENVHGVKQLYNAQSVDGMIEVAVSRLRRVFRYPISVAVQERKQITLFVSKSFSSKELVGLVGKAIAEARKPIAMQDSRQVNLEVNVASVHYPGDGQEPIKLLNCLQTAVVAARRNGLSQYVAYSESLEMEIQDLGAYFEYQRQMTSKNINVYFRRVIESGNANSTILEGQMRYCRDEKNSKPIMQTAAITNDELWLGRFFYEHSMSQLKRINDKMPSRKKLLIRLFDSQIKDDSIIVQLVKAIGNSGLPQEDIIVGLSCIQLKEAGKDLAEFAKRIKDEHLALLICGADITFTASKVAALGVDYVEINARALVDGIDSGADTYVAELHKAKISVVAANVDVSELIKPIKDLGVKLLLGDALSKYVTVKEIINN